MNKVPFVSAVIVAAGAGKRMGEDKNKLLLLLRGKSILSYTLSAFDTCEGVDEIVLVINDNDRKEMEELLCTQSSSKPVRIVPGGATRQESVYNGLLAAHSADIVAIHDGARCFVSPEVIQATIDEAVRFGAAAAGCKMHDTLKVIEDGFVAGTLDREKVWRIQTPQTFLYELILRAHECAKADGFEGTDDCVLAERIGAPVKIVDGGFENIKITTKEDLLFAEGILARRGCEK